jgi:glucose/arabinose dehydrogenase
VEPQNPQLVAQAISPDYAVGPHTASLGLMFAENNALPAPFNQGAIIGQHGSWNRKPHSGYKVLFVPFANGKPSGPAVDLLTGFLNKDEKAMGRPVGVIGDHKGGVLVADDVGNKIWRITAAK